jgi:uncharacterized protein
MTSLPPPAIYVFFGLIATGKSTLARTWAARLGQGYHNSDVVRKELAGIAAAGGRGAGVDQGIYAAAFSTRTYAALLARAEKDIKQGRGAVLDASYQHRADREEVRRLARSLGVPCRFILCVCPEEEMQRRMEQRAQDPTAVSDGRWEIYLEQKRRFETPDELSPQELFVLATDRPVEELIRTLSTTFEARP